MLKLRKMFLSAAAVLVAFSLLSESAGAQEFTPVAAEQEFVSRLNDLRASKGLHSLSVHGGLTDVARGWAAKMAGDNRISHRSNLGQVAPANWVVVGENVGMGPAVVAIHDALVASPTHYANLVDGRYREVGVGVVFSNGSIFVAQNFMTTSHTAASAGSPAQATKNCKARRCGAAKKRASARRR